MGSTMNENIQLWANISQILSLLILVLTSTLQVVIWFRKSQIPVSSFLNRIRPFLPYILTAAFFFWLGVTVQKRGSPSSPPVVPDPGTAVAAVTVPPAVTAVTAVTVVVTPQWTAPPVTVLVTSPPPVVTATPELTLTPQPITPRGTNILAKTTLLLLIIKNGN